MLLTVLTEFIGTFVFLIVVLSSAKESYSPFAVAAGLLAVALFAGKVSGANVNPAISIMMYLKGDLPVMECVAFVGAQVLGGICALGWFNATSMSLK